MDLQSYEKAEKTKVLPNGEPVMIMTTSLPLKDQLEQGINREVIMLRTLADIVEHTSRIRTSDNNHAFASVIYTPEISAEIKGQLDDVVTMFHTLKGIKVFEVGVKIEDEPVFHKDDVKGRFGSMAKFITYALTAKRDDYLANLDPTDEQNQVLLGLRADLASTENKLNDKDKQYQEAVEQKDKYSRDLVDLTQKIDSEFKPEIEKYKGFTKDLQETNKNLENERDIEKSRAEQYLKDKDAIFRDKEEFAVKNKGLEASLFDMRQQLKASEDKIADLENQLYEQNRAKNEIINSRVDNEIVISLNKELAEQQEKYNKLYKDYSNALININRLKTNLNLREKDVEELKNADRTQSLIGRANEIEHIKLRSAKLVYIKIFDKLPFLTQAVTILYKKLKEMGGFNRSHLILLKYEDEVDEQVYPQTPVYPNIGSVSYLDDIARLVPNRSMATDQELFEENLDFVMVVDFVKNSDYYFDTEGHKAVFNVVLRSKEIQEFGLVGLPISYDDDTSFAIKYDNRIANNMNASIKYRMIESNVEKWLKIVVDKILK